MSKKIMTAAVAAILPSLATIALTSGQAQAEKRTFTVAAVEMKGGVTVDKEPFPTDALPAGAGYVLNKPDQTGRWEVSVYMWTPSQIIVNQDDDVARVRRNQRCEPSDDDRRLRQVICAQARASDKN